MYIYIDFILNKMIIYVVNYFSYINGLDGIYARLTEMNLFVKEKVYITDVTSW